MFFRIRTFALPLVLMTVLLSCRGTDEPAIVSVASADSVCAYTIQFEDATQADGFIYSIADDIALAVFAGEFIVVRDDVTVRFLDHMEESGVCNPGAVSDWVRAYAAAERREIEMDIETVSAATLDSTISEVQNYRRDEVAPRGCVTLFQLDVLQPSSSEVARLHAFGLDVVRFTGLLRTQVEAIDDTLWVASDSSCDAQTKVVQAAMAQAYQANPSQVTVCRYNSLKQCEFPDALSYQ